MTMAFDLLLVNGVQISFKVKSLLPSNIVRDDLVINRIVLVHRGPQIPTTQSQQPKRDHAADHEGHISFNPRHIRASTAAVE